MARERNAATLVTPMRFQMESDMTPAGDQPGAINQLREWIGGGADACTLLGVTGSGKTFTVARLV
jgi:excinuclease ABC subunit B